MTAGLRGVGIALLLLPLALQAQTPNVRDSVTAMVIAWWEEGDTRSYAVERIKTGPRAARSTFVLDIHVIESTENRYTLECSYSAMQVEAEPPEDARAGEIFERLLRAADGLRVRFITDENGVPLELVDDVALDTHSQQVLDGILALAANEQERALMAETFGPVLDPAVLVQDALDDLGYLLFPFGVAYKLGVTEEVEDVVPNPFGGPPLRTRQQFTMTALDSLAATAEMRMVQEVDTARVRDELELIMREMGAAYMTGAEHAQLKESLLGVRIRDTLDLTMDLGGAWTTRARLVRNTTAAGVHEREERTYTLRRGGLSAEPPR